MAPSSDSTNTQILWILERQGSNKGGYVPRKVRELIKDLKKAGFVDRGGKGSHQNFVHPKVPKPVTISGNEGNDALRYQETAVRIALEEAKR